MQEVWKDIDGYEGFYQISNLGRLKSLSRTADNINSGLSSIKEKIRVWGPDKNGYQIMTLCKYGKRQTKRAHRLVAEAFISNPENKPEVNHLNGVKDDNRVENLEWCTGKENILHAEKTGLRKTKGSSNARAILNEKEVAQIKALISKGKLKNKEIGDIYGVEHYVVCFIRTGKNWPYIKTSKYQEY